MVQEIPVLFWIYGSRFIILLFVSVRGQCLQNVGFWTNLLIIFIRKGYIVTF